MNNIMSQKCKEKVKLYTDGSCKGNPGAGGWGAILEYKGADFEMSGGEAETTNNRMEITAVIEGLRALKRPCSVDVYSDSKYVVDAINLGWVLKWKANGWMRNRTEKALNPDLWKELLSLLETHEVTFNWIKGHNGNPKNERCDALAVKEAKKQEKIKLKD